MKTEERVVSGISGSTLGTSVTSICKKRVTRKNFESPHFFSLRLGAHLTFIAIAQSQHSFNVSKFIYIILQLFKTTLELFLIFNNFDNVVYMMFMFLILNISTQ